MSNDYLLLSDHINICTLNIAYLIIIKFRDLITNERILKIKMGFVEYFYTFCIFNRFFIKGADGLSLTRIGITSFFDRKGL